MTGVLDLLKRLIHCPSVTPNDAGCQSILADRLQQAGWSIECMHAGDVSNLWARRGTAGPLFVFAGHTDVVPPGSLEAWTSPPFEPTERDGYLYGRGATDMKSGLAAMVVAAEQFVKKYPNYPGSIGFLITSNEEGSTVYGTQYVVERLEARHEKIDYCIVGEATSLKTVGDQIRVGRRGSLNGQAVVRGKQGHVAFPQLADNPIHRLGPLLSEWVGIEWDQGNAFFPPTSFQISNLHAGTGATNIIPGQLKIVFNFRFSTESTVDGLKSRVAALFEKHSIPVEFQWETPSLPYLAPAKRLIPAVQAAIKEATGNEPILSTGGGTSDGRWIAPTGAEVIELGPCCEWAHQVDERVWIADLDLLVDCYVRILEKCLITEKKIS